MHVYLFVLVLSLWVQGLLVWYIGRDQNFGITPIHFLCYRLLEALVHVELILLFDWDVEVTFKAISLTKNMDVNRQNGKTRILGLS